MPQSNAMSNHRLLAIWLACVCVVSGLVNAAGQRLWAAEDSTAAPASAEIVVQVLDEGGQPLPAATVQARNNKTSKSLKTDANGEAHFPKELTESNSYFQVSVNVAHDVPLSQTWRFDNQKQAVPDHLIVHMQKGTTIGGNVKDDEGQPIEGVKVSLLLPNEQWADADFKPQISNRSIRTDDKGQWEFDLMPADAKAVWIRLEHPDYISDKMYNSSVSIDQLHAQTDTLVLKKGIAIRGVVIDDQGTPISGARVLQGSDRFGTQYPATRTDDEGKYEFKSAAPGELVLTVVAKDWMPDLRHLTVTSGMEPVDFKLSRGKTLTVKVVDPQGKPVKGVWIAPDTWRECRTLTDTGLPRETNAEGIWTWTYAPDDAVKCDILKQGFMDIRGQELVARDEPYLFTLRQPLVISGRVLDAQTKQPIEKFNVIKGLALDENPNNLSWERRETLQGTDGNYSAKFSYPYPSLLVRIEADGYLPAISRRVKSDEGTVTCDFMLEHGEKISGLVRLPDGQPAVGADVGLCTASGRLYVQGGFNRRIDSAPWTKTDAAGKFAFPAQTETFQLLVLHDQGVKCVTVNSPDDYKQIDLQPWAKVEGKLVLGKKPGAGQKVALSLDGRGDRNMFFQYDTTTGADGSFRFDRVLPGQGTVCREITYGAHDGRSMSTYTLSEKAEFTSGKTTTVNIGGSGQSVIGRLVLPEGAQLNWADCLIRVRPKQLEIPYPPEVKNGGPQAMSQWIQKWQGTAAAQAYQVETQRRQLLSYAAAMEADGSFRVDGLPPEVYTLSLDTNELRIMNGIGRREPTATLEKDFLLASATSEDEPLDLGLLTVNVPKRLKVGDLAPDFTVTTLDGKSLRLLDLRGKLVVVNFWASWSDSSMVESLNLLAAHDKFADNNKFAMLGLSWDTKEEDFESCVRTKGLSWPQAMIGGGSEISDQWGVHELPAVFLVGPDGKILATELSGPAITQEVQRHLK